ncbi:MAG: DUF58 domain-containing protein [Candidatus Nanoarchaeia archaeon]|nr:DUF58 domain-containing protein [Candidatus Nanoarchaeia archaeon]
MADKKAQEEKRRLKVDIAQIIMKIEALTKRIVQTRALGEYLSVFRGAGMEFEGYKPYTPDIDASKIDWKASVKAKQKLVKIYREIRELEVYFLLDVSSSMIFGSQDKLKNEVAAEFILAMAYTVLSAGDSVGLIAFSDKVKNYTKAGKGIRQFYKLARVVIDPNLYGGSYNLVEAEQFALNYVTRKHGVLVIVSDFYGAKGAVWQKKLKLLGGKFDTICIIVRDPRDISLPSDVGEVLVEDPYTGERQLIHSALLRQKYESISKRQDRELMAIFKDCNANAMVLNTEEPLYNTLVTFFQMRRKRAR